MVLQRGVGSLQSPLSSHSTQACVAARQILLGSVWQSPLPVHSTHRWLCVSHCDVAGVSLQWLSCVHSTQRCVLVRHAGVARVSWQSLFRPHSTQVWVVVKQNGVAEVVPPQSPFAAHPTQTLLLQMGVGALQSEFWLHPATQVPLSQTGVGALQSALREHWSLHVWLLVSQMGVGAAQSPLTVHSTHW